jgi:AraC-like DNA-binding protein
MHPKDRQPSSFDEPVGNGTAAPWRSEAFVTQDVDELIHHLNTKSHHRVSRITPLQRGCPFSFTRKKMNLGRIELVQGRSAAMHMEGLPTCLTIIVTETGRSLLRHRDVELQSDRGDTALVNLSNAEGLFQTSPDSTRFVIQLDRQHVADQLAATEKPETPAVPAPFGLDLSTPVATSFHRAVNFIWQQRTPPSELLRAAFDEILLQGVVSLLTPALSANASKVVADPGPVHLKRACELIRANVAEPVRIAEIATQLGISPRHLQAAFRQHLGTTPQRFLRDCRLDEANRLLNTAKPGSTTTAIAYDCGFGHLGEFAQSYRLRFGESPSETLRRSRHAS